MPSFSFNVQIITRNATKKQEGQTDAAGGERRVRGTGQPDKESGRKTAENERQKKKPRHVVRGRSI